ncbi:unnamed protein product [Clavelina lepadiformis]|uniref:Ig-like domain-containing protein n=1 Tax=Clavelina lepadiformis TaxID=159417 RepID=A0ABP0FFY6_CLALP
MVRDEIVFTVSAKLLEIFFRETDLNLVGPSISVELLKCRQNSLVNFMICKLSLQAPNVTLSSSSIEGNKLTVIEGNDLNLTCNYNDVIPPGNTSLFYIGGKSYSRTQGDQFMSSSLQRSDNNKVVSCQAVTPYTDLYPTSGRSSEYTLDVLYAPQEDDFTTSDDCNGWYVGQSGASCSVVFYSNPSSQFVSFTKNDQAVTNDSMTIKSDGDQQTFEFQKNEVTSSDNGTYTLTVQSSNKDTFPDNVQIIFHIIVADEPPPTPGLSIGAIIGIVCGCVVIILISVAVYVIHKRRKGSNKSGSPSDEVYPNGNGNHLESGTTGGDAVHVNLAFKGDSEKELKINPIYASGGANYAQVDKKNKSKNTSDKGSNGNEASTSNDQPGAAYSQVDVKKKKKKKGSSEKEEKMNPIYEAGDQPAPIEEAYAEVEKKKNKKGSNEKEERINPLYGSSESPDQVEAAYAEVDIKKKKKKKKKGSNEKEERINPLYGSSQSPDQVEAAYAEVDKKKNKNKKGSSEKEEKLNPLYVSSDQPEPTEAAYAEVDKNKKKKQSAKEERINPLYEASSSQDQVEAAYAEVDKSKKKPQASVHASIQSELPSNATYAEVNKPKKKKKPPPPSRANTTDATQVEESSNATYAEVNKPKKKTKPPPPSKENTAGGDGAYDDVDLHGSSSTPK